MPGVGSDGRWWLVTLPARRPSFSPGTPAKCFFWSAATIYIRACRAIWRSGSSRLPISRCSATRRYGGCRAIATSLRWRLSTTGPARCERWKPRRSSALSAPCRGPIGCPKKSRRTLRGLFAPVRLWRSRLLDIQAPPFLLETSRPGVFAAGDVRSGSAKRVGSAVGEGSMAVQFVEEYLKEI